MPEGCESTVTPLTPERWHQHFLSCKPNVHSKRFSDILSLLILLLLTFYNETKNPCICWLRKDNSESAYKILVLKMAEATQYNFYENRRRYWGAGTSGLKHSRTKHRLLKHSRTKHGFLDANAWRFESLWQESNQLYTRKWLQQHWKKRALMLKNSLCTFKGNLFNFNNFNMCHKPLLQRLISSFNKIYNILFNGKHRTCNINIYKAYTSQQACLVITIKIINNAITQEISN